MQHGWRGVGGMALGLGLAGGVCAQGVIAAEVHRMVEARSGFDTVVALEDLDADGDLDLVAVSFSDNLVFLNDGTGRLAAADLGVQTLKSALDVAVGDVNEDGIPDIYVANGEEYAVFPEPNDLYLGNGDGTFTLTFDPTGNHNTTAVELGDVDLDGDLDLLLGGFPDDFFVNPGHPLFLNDGIGHFSLFNPSVFSPSVDVFDLELADVDADLDPDLLVAGDDGPHLYLNDGSGNFTDATSSLPPPPVLANALAIAAGELDGQPGLDFVTTFSLAGATAYFATGGGYALTRVTTTGSSYDVELFDSDADGDLDLMLASGELLLNDGSGAFSDVTSSRLPPPDGQATHSIAHGDLDLDGDPDLCLGRKKTAPTLLFLNDGRGTFFSDFTGMSPTLPGVSYDAEVAAFDGDPFPDVAIPTQSGLRLLLGDGDGLFRDVSSTLPGGPDPAFALGVADLNEDGWPDLYIGNGHDYNLTEPDRLLLSTGPATFADATLNLPPLPPVNTHAVAAGDVDADGHTDLVIASYRQSNELLLGDGAGGLTDASASIPGGAYESCDLALADFDGDGDLDAFVVNALETNELWENDGGGVFTDVSSSKLPAEGNELGQDLDLADVDGDGDLDVVVANRFAAGGVSVRLYRNDGTGAFADASNQVAQSAGAERVTLADLDGDGDADLVVSDGQTFRYLENDGQGIFSSFGTAIAAHLPTGIAGATPADVDLDGDLDLVATSGTEARLLSNLTRQAAYTTLPRAAHDLEFEIHGPPNGGWTLFGSLDDTYIPLPGVGVLQINRNRLFHTAAGPLGSSGTARSVYSFSNDPTLIGRTFYWQTLLLPKRRLTNLDRTLIQGF